MIYPFNLATWGGHRGLVVMAVDYEASYNLFDAEMFIYFLFFYLATGYHAFMSYPYKSQQVTLPFF